MEWIEIVWAEITRLPGTAIFGLIVAGVVTGGLLSAMTVGFISDVQRFAQRRRERRMPQLAVLRDDVRQRLEGGDAA